jgi:hypothetical protein
MVQAIDLVIHAIFLGCERLIRIFNYFPTRMFNVLPWPHRAATARFLVPETSLAPRSRVTGDSDVSRGKVAHLRCGCESGSQTL